MQVTENELREAIRSTINSKEKQENLISEYWNVGVSHQDLFKGLIEPWIKVLKIAKLEAQKTLNNVLQLFRVMITFNTQKLQNIRDRFNDRKRRLNQQTDQLIASMDGGAEGAAIAFMLAPHAYIAGKALNGGRDVAEFFRESGFGDFLPSELDSQDMNTLARAREREQSNPIMKAIRALDSLFMAGYAPSGGVLLEQEEIEDVPPLEERDYSGVEISEEVAQAIIEMGGGIPEAEEGAVELVQSAKDFLQSVKTAKELTGVLGSTASVTNLDEYITVLEKLKQISPDLSVAGRSELESALQSDVEEIMKTEGSEKEAAESYLRSQGIKEPTDEDIAEVTEEQKAGEIQKIAFGNILGQLRAKASESIFGIYENHKEIYDIMYNEKGFDPVIKRIIDDSEYGKLMKNSEEILKDMERAALSTGA